MVSLAFFYSCSSERRDQGQSHGYKYRRRHANPEDLAKLSSLRGHRLCLLLLHNPHRNTGKTESTISFTVLHTVALILSSYNSPQDTIKAPPTESKTMKKATLLSVAVTTAFYMLCGCMGYAAFGDEAPGNLLTGFGFYNPFWLLDIANMAIVIHLVGAYQVYCQPLFAFVEKWANKSYPDSDFITKEYRFRVLPGNSQWCFLRLNSFRLVWRTAFVIVTTVVSMLLPFFNDVVGFLGALGFWPLTVYFPVEMYISQKRIPRWSTTWVCLQMLSMACLVISVAAAAGSIAGVVLDLKIYRPFKTQY